MAHSFTSIRPQGGKNDAKWEDQVTWAQLKPNVWFTCRIIGGYAIRARVWLPVRKKKDNKWFTVMNGAREKVFPKLLPDYDHESQNFVDPPSLPRKFGFKIQKVCYLSVIDRKLQKRNPADCVVGLQLPLGVINKKVRDICTHRKVADPAAVKGMDLSFKYDPSASGTDVWSVQYERKTKLTPQELKLKSYDFDSLIAMPSYEEIKDDFVRNGCADYARTKEYQIMDDDDSSESETEGSVSKKPKSRSGKTVKLEGGDIGEKRKKRRKLDEDESPKKRKAKSSSEDEEKPKKRKKSKADEDEKPKKKTKGVSDTKPKKKKNSEEETPLKKRKKLKKRL